jgi:hypothetical protein
LRVHGVLPDGKELCYMLPDGVGAFEPPELIGWDVPPVSTAMAGVIGVELREMLGKDAFFVKAFLESGSHQSYLLQHVNGFVNKCTAPHRTRTHEKAAHAHHATVTCVARVRRYVYLRPNEVTRMFTAHMEEMVNVSAGLTPTEDAAEEEPSERVLEPVQPPPSPTKGGRARRLELTYHMLGDDESTRAGEHHQHAVHELEVRIEKQTSLKQLVQEVRRGGGGALLSSSRRHSDDNFSELLRALQLGQIKEPTLRM